MRKLWYPTAVMLSIALSACSTASSLDDGSRDVSEWSVETGEVSEALEIAKKHHLDWEVGVLEDGIITASEYEDAYDRSMQCYTDLGYVVRIPKYLDPISGLRWRSHQGYEGPRPLEEMEIVSDETCWVVLDLIQIPYLHNNPERMDVRLLARFKKCLDEHDLPYKGDEVNYNEFTADLNDHDFAFGPHFDCLTESMEDVYPNAMGGGVGR